MVKAGYIGGSKDPLMRKLNYERDLASTEGIDLSMIIWGAMLNNILSSISFNVQYNFLLNMFLCLNLHFNYNELDFNMPNFNNIFNINFENYSKAYYGKSKYGFSIYDPPEISFRDIARMLWDFRYKATCENDLAYKHIGDSLVKYKNILEKYLENKGVSKDYIDGLFGTLSIVEGKVLTASYFDISCFDVNIFSSEYLDFNIFLARSNNDWKTIDKFETIFAYECHFDASKFDYSRFIDEGIKFNDNIVNEYIDRIKDFHARSGQFQQFGTKGLFQHVFFLEKQEKLKWQGGKHQVYLQRVINAVKQILNKHGVIAQFRGAYIAFAQELFYKNYNPHRRYKRYKQILSDDDIVNKYLNMGCDKQVLDEIKGVVTKWRPS